MKKTITVPFITLKNVEVSLPQFRKEGNEYFAFFSEKDTDNIYIRLNGEKLMCYMAWCSLSNIGNGSEISEEEFQRALNVAKHDLEALPAFIKSKTVANTTEGEHYLTDAEKEDWGSTASEQTDEDGFLEFLKQK